MDIVLPILENSAASYVISKLIGAATTYLRDQYYWKTDLQEELQNLRGILPQIQAVVSFSEQKLTSYEASSPALMEWLQQFRDEIDEAEEVLDELEYRELEKKSDSDKSWLSRAVDASVSAAKRLRKRLRKSDDVLERLRTCVKNLSTSASGVQQFLALVTQTGGISSEQIQQEIIPLTNESRIASSLPALSFKGREEEKGKIIQYFLGDSEGESEIQRSQNVRCLPLVAMGGMGKTALAQQVFDHFENVKKEHFDIKIWVCVSTDFNASSLMKKILEYSTRRSESGPLELIPVKLKEELHSKRFLLVLDDAWDDKKQTEWEKLCAPLLYGQKGSWILLTTRLRSVVEMVSKVIRGTMEPIMLPGLLDDECRSLLFEYAFAGQNPNEFPLLKKISEEIVKKLNGVPLLAKSIGGALNSKLEPDHWASILRSEVWKTPHGSGAEFIPALTLSYVMLPPKLKRCFSYCGIFPQDYIFNKQMLVGMWVAAGLIYSDGLEEGSDEDIANRCFDMLCNKSFFDVHTHNRTPIWKRPFYDTEGLDFYTMHDMLNGLARHVSRYECCRIVDVPPSCILDYNAIRHISIFITGTEAQLHDVAKMVCKLKHMRTLWIQFDIMDPPNLDDFIRDACKSPRRIRVLIMKAYYSRASSRASSQCLESISDFVKLRFLDISAVLFLGNMQPLSLSLSKSICKFCFLQVLIGNEGYSILAKDTNKLTNLRHLYGVHEDALLSAAEVEKLTSLQELCFSVGTEPGYRIDELMNMDNLRKLKIKGLSNVRNLEEANKVNLVRKRNLTRLELHYRDGQFHWDEADSDPDLDQQEVLAALRPPPTIRELFIRDYKGSRPAPWMDTSSLLWLESLKLYVCTSLEELPPLWKLPCLKFLKLKEMKAIRSLGCHSSDQMDIQFPVLEELVFNNLPLWEEWNSADDYIWFPHLKSFEIDYCPKLKKIPDLPSSIENLKLRKVTSLQKLCFSVGTESGYRIDELMNMNDLRQLKIKQLSNVQSIEEVNKVNLVRKRNLTRLSCLVSLELDGCTSLEELPPLWKLPRLKFLKLSSMKAIKSLGCHSSDQMDIQFPILEELVFNNFPLWEEWNGADDYIWFPHLKRFEIDNCPKLKKIPDLPLSIEKLHMRNLGLEALPRFYKCSNGSRTFGGFQQLISLESLEIYDCPIIGEEDEILLPSSLKKLELKKLTSIQKLCFSVGTESDYKGGMPAPWINTSYLSRLESLKLDGCTSLEELPPLWKLPCLKFLILNSMETIKSLGCYSSDQMDIQFPVLEELRFVDLPSWEEWKCADDFIWFPHLESFVIKNCPKLKKIPDLPLSIKKLHMVHLGLEALPRSYKCSNGSRTFGGFQQLTSLEFLKIDDYLIIGEENDNLLPSSLKKLRLQGFLGRPKFLSVEELLEDKRSKHAVSSSSVFDHSASNKAILPSSLKSLSISDSDILQESLGRCLQGLTSLTRLRVSRCRHLVSLPNIEYLHNLTALWTLHISDCEELRNLESLTALVTLRSLLITGCPKLLATIFSTPQNPTTTTEESATKIKKGTLPSLEEIVIDSIFYLPNLPMSERLKTLYIKEKLISFIVPVAEFTCFPSEIEEWLLQCRESLEVLVLGEMPHLQSLPASLESFSSLKTFRIYSSLELKSLPRMPASLKELRIYGCSATLEKRCQENIGPDWPNISHIPSIEITADIEDKAEIWRGLMIYQGLKFLL